MINKVILIGNLGADPEIRTLEGGSKVARLRVATTERIYNRATNESREHTEWHTVTLWGQMADFADRFARKGSQVYIEGKIRSREWEDSNKVRRFSVEILADNFRLLGRREGGVDSQGYGASSQAQQASQPVQAQPYVQSQPYVAPQSGDLPSPIDDGDDLPF